MKGRYSFVLAGLSDLLMILQAFEFPSFIPRRGFERAAE